MKFLKLKARWYKDGEYFVLGKKTVREYEYI